MKSYKQILLSFFLTFSYSMLMANNITVSNVGLAGRNTTAGANNVANFTRVKFDLGWSNSWRWNGDGGKVSYIGVKASNYSFTTAPSISISGGGGSGAAATATITSGVVLSYSLTSQGSGYTSAPTITLSGGGGNGATAKANISSGKVISITMLTKGSGYTSAPTVTFTGGGGTGAAATATLGERFLSGITITNPGSGYTSAPTVTITGGGGTATADAHITSWWDAAWVFVKFRVGASDPIISGANSNGTTVTVPSTENLREGMPVQVIIGGGIPANTEISSILSSTQFVLSATPTTQLVNAQIVCTRIWEHALLNNSGHIAPNGSTITTGLLNPSSQFDRIVNPGLGVFIYRSTAGAGDNLFNDIELQWNYGANGINDDMVVEVKVFANEMIYIPQSSFFVGSGGVPGTSNSNEYASLTNGSWTSGNSIPFQINSESALTIGTGAGNLWATIGSPYIASATLSASFPKGFQAFYCMKYEISQGQYRDFLNTLTRRQQEARFSSITIRDYFGTNSGITSPSSRNGIRLWTSIANVNTPRVFVCDLATATPGSTDVDQTNDGESVACNFLTWMDGAAYLDWAGLRPMTELEFEKASRGNQSPIPAEFAWGAADGFVNANPSGSPLSNINTPSEKVTSTSSDPVFYNVLYEYSSSTPSANYDHPLRVGIFSDNVNLRRERAGATYYGLMEMSGNLREQVVSIANNAGQSFSGNHGDGLLLSNGNADVDYWPGINGNSNTEIPNTTSNGTTGISHVAGSGIRGGSFYDSQPRSRISDRLDIRSGSNTRYRFNGIRGVRTAQ